jgi:hypothetical protein
MSSTGRPTNGQGLAAEQPKALRPRQSTPIYFYVYDGSLSEPKFANTLARIETHLTDLELQGRVGRLGPLKSAKEMVTSAIKAGATTIVAVGNDNTVIETLNAIAETKATLGIIPIGKPNTLAELLGIPEGDAAAEVLAARKTELIDLGKVGGYYFLSNAETQATDVSVRCDEQYTIASEATDGRIVFSNLVQDSNCQDGFLELTIESPKQGGWFKKEAAASLAPFQSAEVTNVGKDEIELLVEQKYSVKLPATVSVVPSALKIIVGRERVF